MIAASGGRGRRRLRAYREARRVWSLRLVMFGLRQDSDGGRLIAIWLWLFVVASAVVWTSSSSMAAGQALWESLC